MLSHDRTCDSQTGFAPATRTRESNGRTDERTYVAPTSDCDIPAVSATCARVQADDMDGGLTAAHDPRRNPETETEEQADE